MYGQNKSKIQDKETHKTFFLIEKSLLKVILSGFEQFKDLFDEWIDSTNSLRFVQFFIEKMKDPLSGCKSLILYKQQFTVKVFSLRCSTIDTLELEELNFENNILTNAEMMAHFINSIKIKGSNHLVKLSLSKYIISKNQLSVLMKDLNSCNFLIELNLSKLI